MKYNVTLYITGHEKCDPKNPILAEVHKAVIEFRYNPEDYGNGHYMSVKSDLEPFGHAYYDVRYDRRFHASNPMLFLHEFYADRYDGAENSRFQNWKLTGIEIHEAEDEE